jgi:hypothetical protein
MPAGVKSFGGIFCGLAAVAPFGVIDGACNGFGGDLDVLRTLTGTSEKAADFKRGVMARL